MLGKEEDLGAFNVLFLLFLMLTTTTWHIIYFIYVFLLISPSALCFNNNIIFLNSRGVEHFLKSFRLSIILKEI